MVGSIEKNISSKTMDVPDGFHHTDLKQLPRYICYQAAHLTSKLTYQYIIIILIALFGSYALIREVTFFKFLKQYRMKEYILAPGVMDFTTASPQSVSEKYVNDAVMDFLGDLGNVNPANIKEQYEGLSGFMSQNLRMRFQMEMADWVEHIRENSISQILQINQKEITTDDRGYYKVVALGRADYYSQNQYLGHEDQVIEMELALVPPEIGRRWYLQITKLSWNKAETFQKKKSMEEGPKKEKEKS